MAIVKSNFLSGIEILQAASHRMIEHDGNTVYLFFSDGSNPATSAAKWAVCEVKNNGSIYPIIWDIKWSNGSFNKDQVADDYLTLGNYKYPNF